MKFFLRIKAWQVFLVLVGLPLGLQMVLMPQIMSGNAESLKNLFKIFPLINSIFMCLFMFWMLSLGLGLNRAVNSDIKPKSNFFKFSLIFVAVYTSFFNFVIFLSYANSQPINLFPYIIPFHLFSMFSMFYGIYFISKNLVTAEKQASVRFSSCWGVFFSLWFFPIGIWFLQPRINSIYNQHITSQIS